MGVSVTAANAALDAMATWLADVSMNSGATGSTGANELASATRAAMSWNSAASAQKTNSASGTVTNPGTTAAADFSTWSASTGGTFGVGGPLSSSVTAASITIAAGALTLTGTSPS